jgi:hypothetical protein
MITHHVTPECFDQSGRVLAIDFATRRVVVQWGDSTVGHVAGYEMRGDEWARFECSQGWQTSAVYLAKHGGRDLGMCRDFDRMAVCHVGPGTAPLREWLRRETDLVYAEHRRRAAARQLIVLAEGQSSYTAGQQEQFRALDVDSTLPVSLTCLWATPHRLAIVGDLLTRLRRGLVHGADVSEIFALHRVGFTGATDVDDLMHPLIALGLCRPYAYDPRPGTRCGESDFQLTSAQQTAFAKHGKLPVEPGGEKRWGGWIFWYFVACPRLAELPHYT